MGQKEFSVTLGGRERKFKWTRNARTTLEERYGKGLLELIRDDVVPTDHNNMPTGGGRWSVQVAVVYQGLRHHGPAVNEQRVGEWMETHIDQNGGTVLDILAPCNASILASGILGFKYEAVDEEPEEGKGEAVETTESGSSDGGEPTSA